MLHRTPFTPTVPRCFTLVVAFAVILLSFGCGDEPIDNIRGTILGGESSADASTIYFPMSIGNRWVYRNPDGSEWSREVAQSEIIEHDSYYSFTYNPPLADKHPDFIKSPTYVVASDGIFLLNKKNDINDAIWQTVLQSEDDSSGFGRRHHVYINGVWTTPKAHDSVLVFLFYSKIKVIEHSDFTLLHFPPDYPQKRKVIHMTITGYYNFIPRNYTHDFEVDIRIWGTTSFEPAVMTSTGRFENCLKLEYSAEATPVETLVYEIGAWNARDYTKDQNKALLEHLEDELNSELTKLLPSLMQNLNLQTMWLAPSVGPVKIETPNGIAELVDYDIKSAQ